ncbi:hypothetical protein GGI07_005426 [Coemansia sp. Benny D115]|nr:hypothetical protein GGI07_005426 [Coemansia sp. Benny D115]
MHRARSRRLASGAALRFCDTLFGVLLARSAHMIPGASARYAWGSSRNNAVEPPTPPAQQRGSEGAAQGRNRPGAAHTRSRPPVNAQAPGPPPSPSPSPSQSQSPSPQCPGRWIRTAIVPADGRVGVQKGRSCDPGFRRLRRHAPAAFRSGPPSLCRR